MNLERILLRIEELEQMENDANALGSQKRLELANKEAETNEIKRIINESSFIDTEEYKELQELRITKKWLER